MSSNKPNIVLIFVDNQPADMMGCAGNDEVHTPNLDKLAGDATRFDQAFCPNAMCSPCRASVLTGLMPSQHGIHTWLDDAKVEEWPENSEMMAMTMDRGVGFSEGRDGLVFNNVLAMYTHVHALGTPEWAPGLVGAARRYRDGQA